MIKKLFTILGWFGTYKLAWLGCVVGGGIHGYSIVGSIPMLIWVAAWIWYEKENWKSLLSTTVVAGLYGVFVDSLLVLTGVMIFAEHFNFGIPTPFWMVTLWLGFGALVEKSFNRLYNRWVLCALIGIIGGPMAYLGGVEMGAVSLGVSKELFIIWVGLEWLVAMPLLTWYSQYSMAKYHDVSD